MAHLLLLRINFIGLPPERGELFVGDLFERRVIDDYLFNEEQHIVSSIRDKTDADTTPQCTPQFQSA
jgi:hypothetical protein